MNTPFRIRKTLGEVWDLFMEHVWFFGALAAVSVLLSMIGNSARVVGIIKLVLLVASVVWSIVMVRFALAAADGKKELFSFHHVKEMLPHWDRALGFFAVILCTFGALLAGGIMVTLYLFVSILGSTSIVGFVLLPFLVFVVAVVGTWLAIRLSLAGFIYVDTKESVGQSLKASYRMTGGVTFWTTVLVCLVTAVLYAVGALLFGFGLVVTYPVAMIFLAKYYRTRSGHIMSTPESHTVVVQAAEIEAPTEEVSHHESDMKA